MPLTDKNLWGFEAGYWERLRSNAETDVKTSGTRGVRLSGGPLDTWLVRSNAKELAVGWYATWPVSIRRGRPAGYYRLSEGGSSAVWTPALEPHTA
jgi:hypothetical protein